MANTVYEYNVAKPAGNEKAYLYDDYARNDKAAMVERFSTEHQSPACAVGVNLLSATGPGRHIPGKVSAVYYGTTTAINALTGMATGAVAYDTITSQLKVYSSVSSTWVALDMGSTASNRYAFYAYRTAAYSIAADDIATLKYIEPLVYESTLYNYGSAYSTTAYEYTAPVSGVYTFSGNASLTLADVNASSHGYIYCYLRRKAVGGSYATVLNGNTSMFSFYNTTAIASITGSFKVLIGEKVILCLGRKVLNTGLVASITVGAVNASFSGHLVGTV